MSAADPVAALVAERRLLAGLEELADHHPCWTRFLELGGLIAATSATSLRGVLEQLRFVEGCDGFVDLQAEEALRSAIAALERLIGER